MPRYNWRVTLNSDSNEPYGCSQIKYLIGKSAGNNSFIELNKGIENLKLDESKTYSLVTISDYTFLNSEDVPEILSFVENGNSLFISNLYFPNNLLTYNDSLFYLSNFNATISDSVAHFNFTSGSQKYFDFKYRYLKKSEVYNWNFFADSLFRRGFDFKRLANINDSATFIQLDYGKGKIFLHLNPIVFSNYFVNKAEGFDYAHEVFNSLGSDNIIWDEYYTQSHGFEESKSRQKSPLKYILDKKSFSWSYYILVFLVILFFLFKAKREQRIIPYILPPKNTSIEYAKTIGRFYLGQVEHHTIAQNLIFLFDSFVHKRYNIPRSLSEEERIGLLIKRSHVDETIIRKIFSTSALAKLKYNADAEYLWDLNNVLDYFYKNCK